MKIILADGAKKYRDKSSLDNSQLQQFILSHRFYKSTMPLAQLVNSIEDLLKKNHHPGSRSCSQTIQQQKQQSLQQLALYLNRDNNRQIFVLFEHILTNPRGITYDALSKRLKTDIITVSHYCCKLKKLRLIDWEHEKEGVKVFPKTSKNSQESTLQYTPIQNEVSYDMKDSFMFGELNMNQNIWINISGAQAIAKGGITNEEIKRKIMKHAENKMVRRTVDAMKFFERSAERQGKVFEFKYKNQTQRIKQEMNKMKEMVSQEIDTEIQQLDRDILEWLKGQFPEFEGQNFLLELINNKFKDYLSILGVKQSKRQCTPLKFNRYVKVLNYLHRDGGMRQSQLRALIVKDEALFNVGIMHKRSLMGILEGLRNLKIVVEEDGVYYPGWIKQEAWVKKEEVVKKIKQDMQDPPPKKKVHLDGTRSLKKAEKNQTKINGIKRESKVSEYKKISQKSYKFELFTAVFFVDLEKALKRIYRKAFNRIVYVQRKKNIPKYVPQLNALNLLQSKEKPELNFDCSLETFYRDLNSIVEENGEQEEAIPDVQNELIKFIRKTPTRNANFLRIKYGKNWPSKFQQLQDLGLVHISEQALQLTVSDRLLI